MDFGTEIIGKSIYAADAHTMQTTGNLVGTFVELTAGMKHCQHDLQSGLMHLFVHIHGNASTVIDNFDTVVLKNCDLDIIGIACERLIN